MTLIATIPKIFESAIGLLFGPIRSIAITQSGLVGENQYQ